MSELPSFYLDKIDEYTLLLESLTWQDLNKYNIEKYFVKDETFVNQIIYFQILLSAKKEIH